jgi:hypothetical protein
MRGDIMKKIFLVCVLLLLLSAMAVAEDADTTDVDTEDDEAEDEEELEETNDDESDDETDEAEDDETDESDEETDDEEVEETDDESDEETDEAEDDETEEESDEENVVDQETDEETKIMVNSGRGAKLRMFQLQRALLKQTLIAKEVTLYLEEQSEDVDALEGLVSELGVLGDEARNLDPEADDAIDQFVHIKKDAKEISKEFREIARGLLDGDDRKELAERIRNALRDSADLQKLHESIKDARNDLNSNRVRKAMEHLGVNDEALLERIKAGEMKKRELKDRLKEKYNSLDEAKRKDAAKRLAVKARDLRTKKRLAVQHVKEKYHDIKEQRLESRLEKMPKDKRAFAKNKIDQRIDRLKVVRNRAQHKAGVAENKLDRAQRARQELKERQMKGGVEQ